MTLTKAKKSINKFLAYFGIQVRRLDFNNSPETIKKCMNFYSTDLVIDVGANVGQYAISLMDNGYKNAIISFEPTKEAFEKLSLNSVKFQNWTSVNHGVGAENSEQIINISRNSASSSILNVTTISTDAEPLTSFNSQEKITIVSLDTYFRDKLTDHKSIYLKVDVQGYELYVLEGAKELLSKIKVVQLEMSFVPLYEGGPLYKEIILWMENAGFELYSILPDFRDITSGKMLQADGIFINKR